MAGGLELQVVLRKTPVTSFSIFAKAPLNWIVTIKYLH
jgi:hypothetical protein